jgi:hypothetical protein
MRHLKLPLLALLAVLVVGVFASSALAAPAAAPADTEVVLPSRVANAIARTEIALGSAQMSIDTGDTLKAVASLKAVRANVARADKAARHQMAAVPVDPEAVPEGAATPADSVIGVLTLESTVITTLAGLFDGQKGAVVDGLSPNLFAVMNLRDALANSIIGLDPEGAGADYADGMPDILPDFDDEVANFQEAISDDTLSAGGKKVLTAALAQSQKTDTAMNTAFGGGE